MASPVPTRLNLPVRTRDRRQAALPVDLLILLAIALLPLVFFTVRLLVHGWTPQGDEALVAVRAHDVFSAHPPLTGMRSTSEFTAPGVHAHHPGPMQFYVLAPLYAVTGWWSGSLLITSLLVQCAFVAAAVIGAHRAAGRGAALVVVGVTLALGRVFGQSLVLPLNSWPDVLGLLAVLVLAWLLLLGRRGALLPYAACATFVAQGHVIFFPLVLLLSVGVAATAAVRWWLGRRATNGHARRSRSAVGSGRAWRRTGLITAGLLALLWLPTVVETWVNDPNNVGELWRLATGAGSTSPAAVPVPPEGLSTEGPLKDVTFGSAAQFVLGLLVPFGSLRLLGEQSGLRAVIGLVVVVLAVAAVVRPTRRGMRAGVAMSLAMLVPLIWMAVKAGSPVQLLYCALPLAASLLLTGLVGLWLHDVVARRARVWIGEWQAASIGAVVVLVGAVLATPAAMSPLTASYDGDVARAVSVTDGVRQTFERNGLLGRPVVLQNEGARSWLSLGPAITADLTEAGSTVYFDTGWQHEQDDDHRRIRNAPADAVRLVVRDRTPTAPWGGGLTDPTHRVPFTFEMPGGPLQVEVQIKG
ncbi:hypothetical protein [Luteipulveratus halotolerans]|uniref:Glycosyltransferase RgtA/B/C/D-like domain-containing protein n=1 Tax=Luteipulveratus halotolerans TaxID=1631356 RepID=A0A0L6CMQ1_9MICO|nr:hypothetical protein [Luteipulveratus halotolerans]KNX39066.1 hypothetical protein VV01_21155 [Luteipulveratus halotolerans]